MADRRTRQLELSGWRSTWAIRFCRLFPSVFDSVVPARARPRPRLDRRMMARHRVPGQALGAGVAAARLTSSCVQATTSRWRMISINAANAGPRQLQSELALQQQWMQCERMPVSGWNRRQQRLGYGETSVATHSGTTSDWPFGRRGISPIAHCSQWRTHFRPSGTHSRCCCQLQVARRIQTVHRQTRWQRTAMAA